MERKLKKVSVLQVKLENPGDMIEGNIDQINTINFENGPATELIVRDDEGNLKSCIPGIMAEKIIRTRPIGSFVRLTFKGQEKGTGGKKTNLYDVEVEE